MQIACNVVRQAPLIVTLVNLATARWRGGTHSEPLQGDALVAAFSPELSDPSRAAVQDLPDAAARLAELAADLRGALLTKQPAAMAAQLNAMIGRYGAQPYLVEDVGQPFHLHFHGSGGNAVDALGGEFATALALIVDGYGPNRFGQCEANQCDAVYVDLTRNGSRRYCSAACTSRAKAAAYRARRRA